MRKKILVVDNNPVILRLLMRTLQKENYEVETAADGLEAIERIEKVKPDIVITDLIMPNIHGEKLCQIIRRRPEFQNIFIVVLSAIVAEEKIDFLSFGADACIAKGPAKEMLKNLRTVFEHAARRDTAKLSHHVFGLENVHARQITKELLLTQKNFEITLQNMADGFVSLTPSAKIVSVNAVAADFFKTPEERLVSTTFSDHFQGEQKKIITANFEKITDSAIEIGEHHPVILHGKYLLIKMVPVFDKELRSVIVLIDDITKRKIAEMELEKHRMHLEDLVAQRAAELKEVNKNLLHEIHERQKNHEELVLSSSHWSMTFNTINDFVSVHDVDMKIVRANKALADFLGKEAQELIGQHCYEVMHGATEPLSHCPHLEAIRNNQITTREVNDPYIGKPLLVTCSPCYDKVGNLIGTVHVARDISQQKLAEAEKENLITELQEALSQVKQLSGFLPICASCKKIRDDKGYWNQIESYISQHSEAEFSHGICPDCIKKLYSDIEVYKSNRSLK